MIASLFIVWNPASNLGIQRWSPSIGQVGGLNKV